MEKIKGLLIVVSSILIVFILYYFLISLTYPILIDNLSGFSERKFKVSILSKYFETGILTSVYFICLTITKKINFSFFFVALCYTLFLIINWVKITYLYSPILPTDISQVSELLQSKAFLASILPTTLLILLTFITITLFAYKIERKNYYFSKLKTACYIIIFVFFSAVTLSSDYINKNLRTNGIFYKKNSNLVIHFLTKGFLLNFCQVLFFANEYSQPQEYSKEKIIEIVNKYELNNKQENKSQDNINLIILMIESFTDPYKMGWRTNSPALTNFLNLQKHSINASILTPVLGGKSINAEFELLTGLTNKFIIPESLVYRETLNHSIPSLARTLKTHNYSTIAFRDEPVDLYGFKKIYSYLGFDNAISFVNMNLETDPTQQHSSSLEIADVIIQQSKKSQPFFFFAFTMSSHAPWDGSVYDSKLDFLYPSHLRVNNNSQMKGYINSLDHMDIGIKKLTDYFKSVNEKTMILIIGDHQPHLEDYRLNNYLLKIAEYENEQAGHFLINHTLNAIIWKNFDDSNDSIYTSMNFLPSILLNELAIDTCGLMKFNEILRKKIRFITKSNIVNKTMLTDEVLSLNSDLLNDYELLQYDLLYGVNHLDHILDKDCY